jgi:hypothetical protein
MIGIEILKPKTVVDVSTLLTSTSIRGRNLHTKNHISSSFQVFNCSIIGSTKAASSNQQCKLQTAKWENIRIQHWNCKGTATNIPSTTTARGATAIIFQEK